MNTFNKLLDYPTTSYADTISGQYYTILWRYTMTYAIKCTTPITLLYVMKKKIRLVFQNYQL